MAAADMYGAAFELQPELAESCVDPVRHGFLTELMDTPDYQSLHTNTQLDALASEMAAAAFGKQYVQLLVEQQEREKQGDGEPSEGDKFREDMRNIRAASDACQQATEEVESLNDMRSSLGIGSGEGGNGQMDSAKLAETFKRVRNSEMLKQVCDRAGRYRRFL
ncbi:unnamed protein product, partial [marine sediment metagenome]